MSDKRSPLNKGRTTARNRRKQARGAENRTLRSSLHAQKAVAGGADKAAEIQKLIDHISQRS